ncbi:putative assembly/vacuolar sorting protein [Trichostrongylus colubriformis]|uniref:Assembly/vacuolar sorting protein n=1 Tax=Trichostrongylus colubriformis TaxID=6319 RepID=A0AAN8F4I3_TRICO
MSSWFNKPDPKDQMRENNKNIRRANRELESDRRALERREKELENEIKKLAKQGQKDACAVLAKQLVQLRKQKAKSVGMSSRLTGIGAQNNQMYSMNKMSQVMGQTVGTMKTMEKLMPVERVAKNMKEFQMAQERLGLSEEMMNDALDSILDEPGDEEEQNAIVNKVLDEIGIECQSKLAAVPKVPTSVGADSKPMSDKDIENMLAQLRG